MFAMAGIPPLAGFFGKLFIFQAAIAQQLYTLAVIGVLSSVVAAFYYMRIVKLMYFDEPQDTTPIVVQPDVALVFRVNGLAMLVLGLMPQRLMELCAYAVAHSLQ